MSLRRYLRPLVLTVLVTLLGVPGMSAAGAAAKGVSGAAYVCARVPATVTPGHGFSVSTHLAQTVIHFDAPASVTVPTPYGGVPGNGVLHVNFVGESLSPETLHLPSSLSGSALTSLCLLPSSFAPAILVETYSGGAHCCVESVLYAKDSAKSAYRISLLEAISTTAKVVGGSRIPYDPNQGLTLRTLQGRTVLLGGDGNFPYTFGCYACTPSPLVISALVGSRVLNVSSQFPTVMRGDAAVLWGDVRASLSSSGGYASLFGSLAAWTADECTLGEGASAWREVTSLAKKGLLSDARYHQAIFLPKGYYLPDLDHFLLSSGYCHGQIPSRVT